MNSQANQIEHGGRFEIRFQSLFREDGGLVFPCDSAGRVNMDSLSELGRCNYLFARPMVGRQFTTPSVRWREPAKRVNHSTRRKRT